MKTRIAVIFSLLCGMAAQIVFAHSPICDCYDNGDETITCEGGFSDGGKAVGVEMHVLDGSGKALINGVMDEKSEFTFAKPEGLFRVVYFAGEGHKIEIDGRDIEE